jgi:hypothetical protein
MGCGPSCIPHLLRMPNPLTIHIWLLNRSAAPSCSSTAMPLCGVVHAGTAQPYAAMAQAEATAWCMSLLSLVLQCCSRANLAATSPVAGESFYSSTIHIRVLKLLRLGGTGGEVEGHGACC